MAQWPTGRTTSRARDALWLLVAAGVLGWGLIAVVSSIRDHAYGRWESSFIVGIVMLGVPSYWLVIGAWRRTYWGQRRLAHRGVGQDLPTSNDGG